MLLIPQDEAVSSAGQDEDEDDDITRGVLMRPYEHDKRMFARMQQASGDSKVRKVSHYTVRARPTTDGSEYHIAAAHGTLPLSMWNWKL